MAPKKMDHAEIIKILKSGSFFFECPNTTEDVSFKKAPLFDSDNFPEEAMEIYEQQLEEVRLTKERLKKIRALGSSKSESGALAVNIGFILERLAPTMKGFRFSHNDCRSLFDPIDYVIFEGLATKGRVDRIFFVDIKTGNAKLSKKQREIRSVITNKNVNFQKF